MLEVRELRVRYGTTEAVRGIDLDLAAGEAVALIGPNGAGKTSTLRAISSLVEHEGTVRLDGEDLRERSADRIARDGLIHVPEGRHVFPTLTVTENLKMGALARSRRSGATSMDEVFDLFPLLVPLAARQGYALSGGEQQMVALGRALMGAPRVLLLDEPSLGLAPVVARAVFDALAQITERTSILLVEQNTQLALGLCDRAMVVVDGEVVLRGAAAELSDRDALLASYLGRTDVAGRD